MTIIITNKSKDNLLSKVIVYNIEFSDLSHIRTLSKDCFNIIKEFCGTSYYGDLTEVHVYDKLFFMCKYNLLTIAESHLEMIKCVEEDFSDCQVSTMNLGEYYRLVVDLFNEFFITASEGGHVDILIWLKEERPKLMNKAFESDYYKAFNKACENGHLKVLVWMKKEFPNMINEAFHYDINKAFHYIFLFNCDKYTGMKLACQRGHIHVLNWMKKEFSNDLIKDSIDTEQGCYQIACEYDQVEVVDWLNKEFPIIMKKTIFSSQYYDFSCMSLENEVRKWLLTNYPKVIESGKYDEADPRPAEPLTQAQLDMWYND